MLHHDIKSSKIFQIPLFQEVTYSKNRYSTMQIYFELIFFVGFSEAAVDACKANQATF